MLVSRHTKLRSSEKRLSEVKSGTSTCLCSTRGATASKRSKASSDESIAQKEEERQRLHNKQRAALTFNKRVLHAATKYSRNVQEEDCRARTQKANELGRYIPERSKSNVFFLQHRQTSSQPTNTSTAEQTQTSRHSSVHTKLPGSRPSPLCRPP